MDSRLGQRLDKIEAVLDKWLPEKPDASWLELVFGRTPGSDPNSSFLISHSSFPNPSFLISHSSFLTRPGWDLVKRGGKRWRPLLMVLTAEAIAGGKGLDAALPLTPLVEFPHNASLIHDDIEDNSDQRRGKPAVHLIYGNDTAINSGAFMYFLPLACIQASQKAEDSKTADPGPKGNVAPEQINRIWTVWASHMRALHLGQAMDIAWHRDYNSLPALDEYDRMCRLKTGCLARLAAVLGAYCSGRSFKEQDALAAVFGEAAERLGVGFQILDDVKNLETGVPGKKRGDDIVEGKKSLPVLLYLYRYPEKREFTARCFTAARAGGTSAPEVEEIISAMERAGVLDEAREKGLEYIRGSRSVFTAPEAAGITLTMEGRELLGGLIDMLG